MSNDIEIKAPEQILSGRYANMMQVSHTQEEFVLDFIFAHPPQGELISRLIVSPSHVKRIAAALEKNIRQYEERHGSINEAREPQLLVEGKS